MPEAVGEKWRADVVGIFFVIIAGACLALMGAAHAIDGPFEAQMWTLLVAFLLGAAALLHQVTKPPRRDLSRYEDGVIKAGVIASMFWGVAGLLVGVIIALQL